MTVFWTHDFIRRLGVVTHVRFSDGAYRDHDATIKKLAFLGLKTARDTAPRPGNTVPFGKYVNAGVRFSLSCSPEGAAREDQTQAGEVLDRILASFPGAAGIDYLEGPNEPNHQPIRFGGVSDTKTSFAAVTAYMEALHAALRSRHEFDHVPLLGVSCTPRLNLRSDMDNEHPYPDKGRQPGAQLGKAIAGRTRPLVATEFGYNTGPQSKWPTRVDEHTQAVLLLNGTFDAASLGYRRLYIYELLDEKPDPGFAHPDLHWGIFRFDGTPKVAATAIRNLLRIMTPQDVAGSSPTWLPTVSGLPTTGRTLVMRGGPHVTLVALWNEPEIWDAGASQPRSIAPQEVALGFPAARSVRVFDPIRDAAPIETFLGAAACRIQLAADPMMVEITI
jgi:hypothetical protein